MNYKGLIIGITLIFTLCSSSCVKSSIKKAKITDEMDSVAYALGVINAESLKTDSLFIDPVVYAKAMYDVYNNRPLMNDLNARSYITRFVSMREAQYSMELENQNRERYAEHALENEQFLDQNRKKAGVSVTQSGLQYEVVTFGTGPKPEADNIVTINYSGTRIDGSVFDSSIERGEPATFGISTVIPGFAEALQLMPVGSNFIFYIPSNLAYGSSGLGDLIKPFSTVIFDVKLISIEQ